jgi:hypothetical protein
MAAFLILLVLSLAAAMYGFYALMVQNIRDSLEVSYYKNLHIKSKTIAELKMNDLNLVNHDLWASAQYLSEMADSNLIVDQQYVQQYQNFFEAGPELAERGWDGSFDFDKVSWYLAPELQKSDNFKTLMRDKSIATAVT